MDIWVTAQVVYNGNKCWNKILAEYENKEEAEKEALRIEKETGEKIYTGVIIKKENYK